MNSTLIAVAVKEGKVSPHAGRALTWRVYVHTDADPTPIHCWDLQLTATGCLHEWHVRPDNQRHPLHSVDVAIAASGGEGVARRLAERNTQLLDTVETDPLQAVQQYIAGVLQPGHGHDEAECLDPEHHRQRSQEA
jgi:hypothetical protein